MNDNNEERCFLKGHGDCGRGITREHYISENVLESITEGKRTIVVQGFPWQNDGSPKSVGIGALQSKILCGVHNSSLSDLDTFAGKFFRTIEGIDKSPSSIQQHSVFDGLMLERWLLKVLLGMVKSQKSEQRHTKPYLLDVLTGSNWPDFWGLYVPVPEVEQKMTKDLFVQTFIDPVKNEILVASFRIAGIPFNLCLGKPDKPAKLGKYRPRGLIFQLPGAEKRVEIDWPVKNDEAITYTKVGVSTT